ncbi:MAG TPA: dihydropteroate synthase [Myxococcales bacterium]|nr:dihydropteroate synthase [Myxococcales bacterium]
MKFEIGERSFGNERCWLMGVVNVTPDSFSDGGAFLDAESAIAHGIELVAQGAHVLDVGGESTRPGAAPVSVDEEIARVVPVIAGLKNSVDVPISIDTTKASVAHAACCAGAQMVNDVSGLTFDEKMAAVVAEAHASLCVMHIQGTPETMQNAPLYENVCDEVAQSLLASVGRAERAGVAADRIIVDPGIGFGKELQHNLDLINGCSTLEKLVGRPVLMGVSRKSFIGQLTGQPVHNRLHGTSSAVAACVLHGARMVRIHDVEAMRDVVLVAQALR